MTTSLEHTLRRLQAVLAAINLGVWLVLLEFIVLVVSRPLEMHLGFAAALAGAASLLAILSRLGALRWEPPGQRQRSLGFSILLEAVSLLGVIAFVAMQFRAGLPPGSELALLQSVALAQFVSGVMIVPFLARTTGRLGAVLFQPLLRAVLYWAEFVLVGAVACWVASFFTESTFVVLFGYVGPILAVGFQLALRNLLVELLRIVRLGVEHAGNTTKSDASPGAVESSNFDAGPRDREHASPRGDSSNGSAGDS